MDKSDLGRLSPVKTGTAIPTDNKQDRSELEDQRVVTSQISAPSPDYIPSTPARQDSLGPYDPGMDPPSPGGAIGSPSRHNGDGDTTKSWDKFTTALDHSSRTSVPELDQPRSGTPCSDISSNNGDSSDSKDSSNSNESRHSAASHHSSASRQRSTSRQSSLSRHSSTSHRSTSSRRSPSYRGPASRHNTEPTSPFCRSPKSQRFIAPSIKLKFHFHEDTFVMQVPRSTEYAELVEKISRNIRLFGLSRGDSSLCVKYVDEDGDMLSLVSTEDLQVAFEKCPPGGQITLFVT